MLEEAGRPTEPLAPELKRRAAQVLIETLRAEDSCFAIDDRRLAAVLPASSVDGARALIERLRFRLATDPGPGTPPRYLTVAAGAAEWEQKLKAPAGLVREALSDLSAFRSELARQRRAFA